MSVVAGQLIALEGASGIVLRVAAEQVLEMCGGASISNWDASGVFGRLRSASGSELSPQSLLLAYASDLAFRLRSEIQPALKKGERVIAVPYVETAVAFGRAAGFAQRWLRELFGFAPPPSISYCLQTSQPELAGSQDPEEGYLEFCEAALHTSFRAKSTVCLAALPARR